MQKNRKDGELKKFYADKTIYSDDYIFDLLEEDEITPEEAGFMEGYL